jgi:hypothetical protein
MKTTPIDNGFEEISTADAKKLVPNGKLPRHGYEALVLYEGQYYWLARTVVDKKVVWSIRLAKGWELVNGNARTVGV